MFLLIVLADLFLFADENPNNQLIHQTNVTFSGSSLSDVKSFSIRFKYVSALFKQISMYCFLFIFACPKQLKGKVCRKRPSDCAPYHVSG